MSTLSLFITIINTNRILFLLYRILLGTGEWDGLGSKGSSELTGARQLCESEHYASITIANYLGRLVVSLVASTYSCEVFPVLGTILTKCEKGEKVEEKDGSQLTNIPSRL